MEAASTAERSIPEITPGKIFLTIWDENKRVFIYRFVKAKEKSSDYSVKVAKNTISRVHVIPIFADFFKSFCDLMDMNLIMICGIPK